MMCIHIVANSLIRGVIAKMSTENYVWATGKRKCAIAQVRILPGEGNILVDNKVYNEVFPRLEHQRSIESPFLITNTVGKYRVMAKVTGGGKSGQADAIGYGIAKALVKENELFKEALRKGGWLTRDARIKERRKYGLKKARKAQQYTKR